MLKRFTAMFLVTVMLLCLTACSSTPKESTQAGGTKQGTEMESVDGQQEEEITLTFWMEMTTPELDEIYQAAVDRYMQSNPNIKIEYLGIPGNAADAKSKLEMAFSANAAPDVFQCFMPEFITRGNIIPLTDYFEASDLNGKISKGSIEANIEYDPNKKDLYAIPSSINVRNFWIRTDWYKENSIEIPETWDEFFDSVKKLADPANNRYGTTIRGGAGGAQNLEYMMYAYSGITEAFDENGKSTINDPLNVEFCEKYLSLYKEYTAEDDLNKGWTEIAASFTSGSTASIFHNLGSAHMISETFGGDETKFQMMPFLKSVNGEQCHPEVGVMGFGISASTEHPDEAWDFIQFLSSEGTEYWVESRGGIPTEQSAQKADWVMEKDYYQKAISIMNDENTVFFEVPTYLTNYVNIENNIAQPKLQECMAGICTAQEFLDAWADAMTEEKARYDAENGN